MQEQTMWNAGLYDGKHSFVWKMATGLIDLLAAQPGERILDIGCGTGHLTAQIAKTGAHVTGVDRSPEMIGRAQQEYPDLRFHVMDAREIAFPESFDAVFSNATLHWITEPERVITGIARSLRPGGRFVAEFGGKGNIAQFLAAADRAWSRLEFPATMPHPWFYPSVAEYAGLLENHGLEVTHASLFDRPTPLEDGERGLRNWMEMFVGTLVETLSSSQREQFKAAVEQEARPALFRDSQWIMDYRRLRIVANRSQH
ncbi:MAG TPA: methyltransferase domain-containing protein [Candidatus Acidoferrales bacterium]|nr:methyltransferase domain-containing protein [Candidatus Acidoferrales bacterium]